LIVSHLTAISVLVLLSGPDEAGPIYGALMWGVVPLSGAVTAFFAVRLGLNAFAAFWLPPVTQVAAHWLISGMPPLSAGMPMTAALISIVGAATGEEWIRRGKTRGGQKKKKTGGATWRKT
jgi:hypothetical protein